MILEWLRQIPEWVYTMVLIIFLPLWTYATRCRYDTSRPKDNSEDVE